MIFLFIYIYIYVHDESSYNRRPQIISRYFALFNFNSCGTAGATIKHRVKCILKLMVNQYLHGTCGNFAGLLALEVRCFPTFLLPLQRGGDPILIDGLVGPILEKLLAFYELWDCIWHLVSGFEIIWHASFSSRAPLRWDRSLVSLKRQPPIWAMFSQESKGL